AGRIDGENVWKRRVGRQRRRFSRPAKPQHLTPGKAMGGDCVPLVAAEQNNMIIVVVAIIEGDVPGRGFRIPAPENSDAAAARLVLQILAELLVAAGEKALRPAVTGEGQTRSHESRTPWGLVMVDLRMSGEAVHLEDLGVID